MLFGVSGSCFVSPLTFVSNGSLSVVEHCELSSAPMLSASSRRVSVGLLVMDRNHSLIQRFAEESESKSKEEEEEEQPQTLKGIIVFVVTMALFALGLAATLGRSMLPSGLAPPA